MLCSTLLRVTRSIDVDIATASLRSASTELTVLQIFVKTRAYFLASLG